MSSGNAQLQQLAVDIAAAIPRVGAGIAKEIRDAGRGTQETAERLVPVDTGELKNSIDLTTEGDGRSAAMSATVTADTDYAFYVEFGTSRMAPQPYLGPALDQHGDELVKGIQQIVDNLL